MKINGIEYQTQKEFVSRLRRISQSTHPREWKEGERYRAVGSDALYFTTLKEAREFYALRKKD